jgi:rhamnogalacturonan endolyase
MAKAKRAKWRKGVSAMLSAVMLATIAMPTSLTQIVGAATSRQVEALTRGMSVTALASGTLVSWRYLGTDSADTVFKLYRDGTLIYTSSGTMATCYKDASGSVSSDYSLEVYKNGSSSASERATAEYKLNYEKASNSGYFNMELDVPKDSRLGATYTPNDASVADLDGDGQYELIVKWDPSNSKDNSKDGETSNVIIDAYEFEAGDATRLWRIDLGQNIRAGAHYTQFMVYDLDGDGKAEMVCKTAPGSKDGKGNYVNTASSVSAIKKASDNTTSYADSKGRILSGSEYLTLFDGQTGKALDTIYYEPERGTVSDWGDSYGNRVDRFLGGIAYLNGKTPSVVMCRGYYTRSVLAAYNVSNKRLKKQWIFDTNDSGNSAYAGQGNHSLTTADVDGDGYDEIVYGSMTVDHNGKGLYSTGLKHGDALHVGDFIPSRDGLEVYQVHEETYGASLRDAKTGEIIQRWTATTDTGRGIADNISASNAGAEFVNSDDGIVYNSNGKSVMEWSKISKWGQNSLVYWDGDLEREVMDRTMIDDYPNGRLFTGQNVTYNNSSKANMCITADIFGDWREEIVAPLSDGTGVKVYTTSYDTDSRVYTLMHNTQYRCGVAAENVGYNQPPHVSYFMGTGYSLPSQPSVYTAGNVIEELTTTTTKATTTTTTKVTTTTTKATTTTTTTEATTQATTAAVSGTGYTHSFDNGTASGYYTISGKLSTAKGSVTYGGTTINQCLKVESSTAIGFTAATAGSFTMVFNTSSAGSKIKIDGTSYTIPTSGVLTVSLSAGTHTFVKGSGSSYLYYMSFAGEEITTTTQKPTTTTTEAATETTTKSQSGLTALSEGTYYVDDILNDTASFKVTNNQVNNIGQLKLGEDGSLEFCVNSGANVTINYKCGSSNSEKTAAVVFNGQTSDTLYGGQAAQDLYVSGLSAGTYAITATQTGGTTAQIISVTVAYG